MDSLRVILIFIGLVIFLVGFSTYYFYNIMQDIKIESPKRIDPELKLIIKNNSLVD